MGLPALVTGAALAVYGNTLENGFVWDDNDIIVDNPAVRDLGSIPSLFSSVDATRTAHHAAYYRPLARLTYLLDYQLFGLSPAGYHLGNVLLHALAVLALFLLVRALFGDATRALAAALLFAVHPLNAEAANFVSTRNTILATLFTLVALAAYHRARAGGPAALLPASWLSFLAGLLSKETAAGLLLLLPVYDLPRPAELRATLRGRALRLLPFVAVFAGYLALRTHALSSAIGADLDLSGLTARLGRIAYLVPRYLGIVLFPLELNAYYQLPQDWPSRWPWLALAWAAIAAALWLCLRLRSRAAAFGLLWFGVNLLPIVGVVPIPSAVMAERYLYLPAVGLWIVAGDLFARASSRVLKRGTGL